MPKSKSAKRAERASERKRLRNRSVRSTIKTYVTRAEKLISGNEPESAQQAVLAATSTIDKAAKKGVIHPNTAARRKSRLMKKFNQAKPSSNDQQKPTDTDTVEAEE